MNELFTKNGVLKKKPPKKYECRVCNHLTSKPSTVKLTGVSFYTCDKCGGSITERNEYIEWNKRKIGQWDVEQSILEEVKNHKKIEKDIIKQKFKMVESWLFDRSFADLCYNNKLYIEKENEKYYYSISK